MRRRRAAAFLCAAAMVLAGSPAANAAPDVGADIFARCAACHLSDGAGVPGAFPPLRGQVARFSGTDAGRLYLVCVLTQGLTGPLEVAGASYAGFMPAQPMSDTDAAALLNHLAREIAGARAAPRAFTAAEVAAAPCRRSPGSAQSTLALRPGETGAAR